MDYLLLLLAFICLIAGLVGSLLPVIPGPPLSWVGILLLYLTHGIPFDYVVVGITLLLALGVTILDFVIPGQGAKRFGGSRWGIWGTNIGLVIGLFFPPVGFLVGAFLGAIIGELIHNPNNSQQALKAAVGSFMGFLVSTLLKLMICIGFLILYIVKVWEYSDAWF